MDITTTGIEVTIRSYTGALDAERAKLRRLAAGEIQVQDRQHAVEQSQMELTRLQGVVQGLNIALQDIKAQQQGYRHTLDEARNTVEIIRLH